jgi:translation initiation factor IF-1
VIVAALEAVATVINSLSEEPRWRGSGEPGPAFFPPEHLSNENNIEVEGRILTVLQGSQFQVELDGKQMVNATVSSKMWKRWVRLNVGDRVKMDMAPYDLTRARITWRLD